VPVAAAAIGATGAIGSAVIGATTRGGQSSQVQQGQDASIEAQQAALAQMRQDLLPYMQIGQNALLALPVQTEGGEFQSPVRRDIAENLSGIWGPAAQRMEAFQNIAGDLSGIYGPEAAAAAMQNFYTSPGYQFRLNEGIRAIESSAAGSGLLHSGATLKALQDRGEGLAANEYANYITNATNQFNNQFGRAQSAFDTYYNRLYNLASLGQKSAAGVGDQTVQTGHDIAGTLTSGASAQAALTGQQGAQLASLLTGLTNNQGVQNALTSLITPTYSGDLSSFAPTGSDYYVAPGWGIGGYERVS